MSDRNPFNIHTLKPSALKYGDPKNFEERKNLFGQ